MARNNFLFGRRLHESRLRLGISQSDVANVVSRRRTSVVEYEKGQIPSVEVLEKLADIFGTSVDYLLGRTDHPHLPAKGGEEMEDKMAAHIQRLTKEVRHLQITVYALEALIRGQQVVLPEEWRRLQEKARQRVANEFPSIDHPESTDR